MPGPFRVLSIGSSQALARRNCRQGITNTSHCVDPNSAIFPFALFAFPRPGISDPSSSGPRCASGPLAWCVSAPWERSQGSAYSCGPWSQHLPSSQPRQTPAVEGAALTKALMLFIPSQITVHDHRLLFLPRNQVNLSSFPLGGKARGTRNLKELNRFIKRSQ